jgi:hypothetical protein
MPKRGRKARMHVVIADPSRGRPKSSVFHAKDSNE